MSKTQIRYEASEDEWGVKLKRDWFRLHCGKSFQIALGKAAFDCHLELDANWYVILPNATRLIPHPRSIHTVIIDS